jgi:hypothetical protein
VRAPYPPCIEGKGNNLVTFTKALPTLRPPLMVCYFPSKISFSTIVFAIFIKYFLPIMQDWHVSNANHPTTPPSSNYQSLFLDLNTYLAGLNPIASLQDSEREPVEQLSLTIAFEGIGLSSTFLEPLSTLDPSSF